MNLIDVQAMMKKMLPDDLLPGFTAEIFRTEYSGIQVRISRTLDLRVAHTQGSMADNIFKDIYAPIEDSLLGSSAVREMRAELEEAKRVQDKLDQILALLGNNALEEEDNVL